MLYNISLLFVHIFSIFQGTIQNFFLKVNNLTKFLFGP